MKIAVMGAGAVGCYFGGLLAEAGHDVVLIGRAAHVDAILARGLLLQTSTGRRAIPMEASTDEAAATGAEVVLVCVKSGDTEAAGRSLVRHLSADAVVLNMQNGVDNAERLQAVLARPVVPVAVYVATEMAGPGHVKHNGRGDLIIGEGPRSEAIAAAFTAVGIPTSVSSNVVDALWSKLILNCAYNALSAITRRPYGRMIRLDGVEAVMGDVVDECMAVAAASGVAIPDDCLSGVLALAGAMPDQFSSTAQDLARERASEIDHLNGYVVRRGEALGVPTPVNRVLHTLVKALEVRENPQSGLDGRLAFSGSDDPQSRTRLGGRV